MRASSAPPPMRLVAPPAPAMGELIDGKYRVISLIGEGGMGTVLAAHHELLDVRVAVKLLSPALAKHRSLVERFLREAQAAARLKSEHVARVLDVGTLEGGEPYLVMDLLEGEDLEQRLQRVGPMAITNAVDCCLQALEAMAHAHAAGIVHRDLKPANLFATCTPDGREVIKVLDFGIAKLNDAADGSGTLTDDHATLGSPSYMAPEQVRASRVVDQRADVWALGAILYELLTGRVAFGGQSVGEIFGAILHEKAPRLGALRPDAPVELEDIIGRCLEREPRNRFADVSEVANALAPFGSGVWVGHVERIQQTLARAGKISSDVTSPGWTNRPPSIRPPSIRIGPRASAPDDRARNAAAAAETLAGEPREPDLHSTSRLRRKSPMRVIAALGGLVVALSFVLILSSRSSVSSAALLQEVQATPKVTATPPRIAPAAASGPLPADTSSAAPPPSAASAAPPHGRAIKPAVRSAPPIKSGALHRSVLPGVLDSPD